MITWKAMSGAAKSALTYTMAATLFLMMALGLVDVTGRYFFNAPIPGASEIAELLMGLLVFGCLPLVTAAKEHIALELLNWTGSGWLNRVRHFIVSLFGSSILVLIAWQLVELAHELQNYGDSSSYLHIPLAPIAWFTAGMSAVTAAIVIAEVLRGPSTTTRNEDTGL